MIIFFFFYNCDKNLCWSNIIFSKWGSQQDKLPHIWLHFHSLMINWAPFKTLAIHSAKRFIFCLRSLCNISCTFVLKQTVTLVNFETNLKAATKSNKQTSICSVKLKAEHQQLNQSTLYQKLALRFTCCWTIQITLRIQSI